ncbi:PREDICTED: exocyst complex component SEC8-like [Ipomoea nil]|uniref:exocyst complex component SEC8-like n=1 Tax=Ipomoea nil TaxID=35883 RepID=UPI00090157F9|nr:PREDICTED: exocyst complex component SEC8-like [Ipomoea nil]
MLLLFFSEFRLYLHTVTETRLIVDTSRGEKLHINFDVTFPAIRCSLLSVDAMDISGEQHLDIRHDIFMKRIDSHGNVLKSDKKELVHLRNDGLLAFVENFVKYHFLPAMFVDYKKAVQQAIASPATFRPRAQAATSFSSSIEKGRPVLQGLLAIDFLAKEVLGWAQAMPKFAADLVNYVQTFNERTYERWINRELQGLTGAMFKLWEKCHIAKIALKWGVPNTDNEQMASELKAFESDSPYSIDDINELQEHWSKFFFSECL